MDEPWTMNVIHVIHAIWCGVCSLVFLYQKINNNKRNEKITE